VLANPRKAWLILILTGCMIAAMATVASANALDDYRFKLTFKGETKPETTEMGAVIQIMAPLNEYIVGTYAGNPYYAMRGCTVGIKGVVVKIVNPTDRVMVIKWAESSLSIGSTGGTPFLDGMLWNHAGNPAATPDTLLAPWRYIIKEIYLPQVMEDTRSWSSDKHWMVVPEPVRKDNTTTVNLILKIVDGNGRTQYFSTTTPPVWIP
jgi:hypothetical protein